MIGLDMGRPGSDTTVIAVLRPAPRGALFQAALGLLGGEADPLARLCLLRDAFPQASLEDILQTLRQTAVLFHAAGLKPVKVSP